MTDRTASPSRDATDRGLAVALKNDLDQIPELVGDVDFAINEECIVHDECDALTPFIAAGEAVFHVECTDGALDARARDLSASDRAGLRYAHQAPRPRSTPSVVPLTSPVAHRRVALDDVAAGAARDA